MVGTGWAQLGVVPPAGSELQRWASNWPCLCCHPVGQRSTLWARGGSHGDEWPRPSCGPKAGRVWCGVARCAPPVPATRSRCPPPGASLAVGMRVLLPEETGTFLAFFSLARARWDPLGDMFLDCLSFRPSTLPMPFLVSVQNHQLLEGPKRR